MSDHWEPRDREELCELADRGPAFLGELVSRYRGQLERMITVRMDRRLYGRIDVADVLQEAYLELARRTAYYLADPSVPPLVWLREITAQSLIDLHRRHLGAKMRDVRQEVSLKTDRDPLATSDSLAEHLMADCTSPSQAAIREETLRELRRALASMEPIDREILALRHFEDLGNNEVARILGLQKSAASNRYVRALKRLQGILSRVNSPELSSSGVSKSGGEL